MVASHSGPSSNWRDAKVFQDHAYVVSEGGGGIQIFDMSLIDSGIVPIPELRMDIKELDPINLFNITWKNAQGETLRLAPTGATASAKLPVKFPEDEDGVLKPPQEIFTNDDIMVVATFFQRMAATLSELPYQREPELDVVDLLAACRAFVGTTRASGRPG